jgi:Family of unknown function (DUF5343)
MSDQDTKRPSPAYVPYKTFTNFINGLRENGIPSRIDRSAMHGMSGSAQAALKSSLEYLGLTNSSEEPTEKLHQLVDADDKSFGAALLPILYAAYPFLMGKTLDLARATTRQIEEAFREQGISGSTVTKSIAFFLAAAKAAGVKVSPYVRSASVPRPSGKKKAAVTGGSEDNEEVEERAVPPAGTKQLKLPIPAGGNLILTMPAEFTAEDWQFLKPIFDLYIQKMLET